MLDVSHGDYDRLAHNLPHGVEHSEVPRRPHSATATEIRAQLPHAQACHHNNYDATSGFGPTEFSKFR